MNTVIGSVPPSTVLGSAGKQGHIGRKSLNRAACMADALRLYRPYKFV